MDFTDSYIVMCEKATKIQSEWKPTMGDWVQKRNRNLKGEVHNVCPPQLITSVYQGTHRPAVRQVNKTGSPWQYDDVTTWRVDRPFHNETNGDWWKVWLPRQDQLQDMIPGKHGRIDLLIKSIAAYWPSTSSFADTMEKVWLAMVMKRLYNKQWQDGGWKQAA